jgi:predicted Zn-dependent protease
LPRRAAAGVFLALIGFGIALIARQAWASYHVRGGRACLDRYHNREAYDHLQAALTVWPGDRPTLFLAARAARRLSAFDEARHDLEQCRGWNDDDLTLERALLDAQRGDVDAVGKFCRAQIDAGSPATPLILEALAAGDIRTYRLNDAEQVTRQWLERAPDNPQAVYLDALVAERRDKLSDAAAGFRRVLQLDPSRDDARQHLAGVLVDLLQPEEALPQLEYLRRRLPNDANAQFGLARCREQLGQPAEAEKELDDLLARHRYFVAAVVERGKLDLQAGRLDAAEARLRDAVRHGPGDHQAHYLLQQCLLQQGKMSEARDLTAPMKKIEQDNDLYHDIVTVRLQLAPHDPSLHYELGRILLHGGAVEEGLAWLQSALQEDPGYGPAHEALAEYYEALGNQGLASRHRTLAAEAKTRKRASGP